jgi:peptidoglycan/xylan/chitin deacetylase (PgdA/CDA1 family)
MKRFFQTALRRYHWRFCRRPLPDRLAVYFHTLDRDEHEPFAAAINWIKSQGYTFVSPGGFHAASGKVCSVSFDDNFQAWHTALPLFESLGLRAAFFINTCVLRGECSDAELERYCRAIHYQRPFVPLSRQEIREMHDAGHWIGAHTHSHVQLSRVSPEAVEFEMRQNRAILEEIIGRPVTDMAFTFGFPRHFSPSAQQVCLRLGFKTVAWATPGMLHHQKGPPAIHRTQWNYAMGVGDNVKNLEVNGRLFVALTGRSPIG